MKIKFLSKREINSLIEELDNISLIPDLPKIRQVKSFELTDDNEIFSSSNFILVRNEDSLFPFFTLRASVSLLHTHLHQICPL